MGSARYIYIASEVLTQIGGLDNLTCHGIRDNQLFGSFAPWDDRARERVGTTTVQVIFCRFLYWKMGLANLMIWPVYVYSKGRPLASSPFSTLKTDNRDATVINSVASTTCLPGHDRFPYPNAATSTGSSSRLPSGLRNRSGLKTSGSGYLSGSCKIALQTVEVTLRHWESQLTMYFRLQSRLIRCVCVSIEVTRAKEAHPLVSRIPRKCHLR